MTATLVASDTSRVLPSQGEGTSRRLTAHLRRRTPMAVLGAGQVGQAVVQGLRARGVPVVCFIDESPDRQARQVLGIDVVSLLEATQRLKGGGCIVCAFYLPHASLADTRLRIQQETGIEAFAFLPLIRELDQLAPYYCFEGDAERAREHVAAAEWLRARLSDQLSRDVLDRELALRLALEPDPDHRPTPPMSGVSNWPGDTDRLHFVDCGAYDGDTVAAFIARTGGSFERVHALEPDARNYERLLRRIGAMPAADSCRIATYPIGVSDRSERLPFAACGTAASGIDVHGDATVEVVALDDLLETDVSYLIKLDVEGAESRALRGARNTLAAGRSAVALSLYHRPEDIVDLPRQVEELMPGATFVLRSHGFDGTDLMLYAFPSRV